MTGTDEIAPRLHRHRAAPDWSEPHRCRDRLVFDAAGRRIGHVDCILHEPAELHVSAEPMQDHKGEAPVGLRTAGPAFVLVVLGSVSRFGNEARAIPADLFAEAAPGHYVLPCEADAVRSAPIYVEGSRCSCTEWFARVRAHFAAFGSPREPSGKPPHSSSP